MKIHGTAKGGALSKKDFGVAFGGGAVVGAKDCTGYTATTGDMSVGYIRATKITASSSYTVTGLMCNITDPAGNVKLCLYSDNSDAPNLLLANTGSKTAEAGLTAYELAATYDVISGTSYWISFQSDNAESLTHTGSVGSTAMAYRSSIAFGTTLSPFGTASFSTTGLQLCNYG